MASNAILEQKKQQVEQIKKLVSEASSFVLIDYCDITAAQDTELSNDFRKNDVHNEVIKNTVMRLDLKDLGHSQ